MVRKSGAARAVYDKLKLAAPYNKCPFCGQRDVKTLDHYLPKSTFPELAVTPVNLVPACSSCNQLKGEYRPASYEEQLIHPYFDDASDGRWLYAEVHENAGGAAVRFFVLGPREWGRCFNARVKRHFEFFDLGTLYSSHAAEQISNIAFRVQTLRQVGGPESVKNHLNEEAQSYFQANLNSWQAALYEALAASDEYCRGGLG